ncbi:hypothetical protein R1flu_023939 [Riccia fluitans]|uniref:Uncharacterized protein n=1 Tax=Riccia fluitans TaxID=41844 RepID=A0ABD1XTF7_9MARC
MLECNILRRRSWAEWAAKGETCSKYFFAMLRTKQAMEKMTTLCDEGGQEIKDEDEILGRVHRFYEELYAQPPTTIAESREQARALRFVDHCVTEEGNHRLLKKPEADEV